MTLKWLQRRSWDDVFRKRVPGVGSGRTYWYRPDRYEWNHRWAASWMLNVVCRRWSGIEWSTISKAEDKSNSINSAESPWSTACRPSMSESNRRTSGVARNVNWGHFPSLASFLSSPSPLPSPPPFNGGPGYNPENFLKLKVLVGEF